MSVINRMLADLEHRGAPGAGRAPGPGRDERRRRQWPWRSWLARALPVLLLAGLIAVAGALWRERAPDVLALMTQARSEGAPAPGRADAERRAASAPDPAPAVTITRLAFERARDRVRLVAELSEPVSEPPGYSRDGDRLVLRLPARWNGGALPAPPPDSSVFRGLAVAADGPRATRLALTVAADARFDLRHGGERVRLTGHVPGAGAAARADAGAATSGATSASGTAEGAAAEQVAAASGPGGSPAEADAAGADDERTAEPTGSGDASGAGDAAGGGSTPAGGDGRAGADGKRRLGGDGEIRKTEPRLTPAQRARQRAQEARTALRAGDTRRARQRLRAALDADPGYHDARDLLVKLALRAGRTGAARNLLAEGLQRAPRRAGFAKPYARLLVDAGELERALRVLERAEPAGERDGGYHGLKAAIAQRLGRHERAAAAYEKALAIDRERGVWWLGLGISLAATDQPGRAREAFRRARATGDLDQRLDDWAAGRIEALSQE